MARLVVVDPDPRIRGALVRLITSAGHVADEVGAIEDALELVDGAALVFVAAGPGGSAIDAAMAVLQEVDPLPRVVWTGPVAALIRSAVDAGVGMDCLELPTRLPALSSLLARHIQRKVGDRWAGETFLHQIRGKGSRFPPVRVLFLAHRLGATGVLRIDDLEVVVKQGRIADARGLASVGSGGGIMHAIGMAIGRGENPDDAMRTAGVEVLRALVGLDASERDVSFTVEDVRAPVVLPTEVPRLLSLALSKARPPSEVKRALAGRPSRAVRLHAPDDSPETAWGLTPVALRVVRAAARAQTLGALVSAAGGAERDAVWEAVDFLLKLGILRFEDNAVHTGPATPPSDVVFSDIVIEAVETTPVDPKAAALSARAAELEATPPWELFDLSDPANVTVDHVAERFRALSVAFHPDRHTTESAAVQEAAASCFAALGDARDRFDDEAFRAEVRARLIAQREGRVFVSDTDRKKARMAATKGEHAVRRKDWATATTCLEEAVSLDPEAWEAALQLAVARWRSGATTPAEAAAELEKVRPATPAGRADARFQLGEARLAAGDEAGAYAAFEEAVVAQASHVGAARRLRMRARRGQAPAEGTDEKKGSGLRGMFGWGRRKS